MVSSPTEAVAPSRNLVVCCDGTGNVWQPGPGRTNIVKLFEALTHGDAARQLCYYDPGVGTPDGSIQGDEIGGLMTLDTLRRVGGLAWGDGVWTNVAQAYLFLVRHHRPGDRIFLFGFSRGAFTVRAVSGLIHLFGLLRPEHDNLMPMLLRVYRLPAVPGGQRQRTAASLRAQCAQADVPVHFIGVWETVETVGMSQALKLGTQITSDPTVKPCVRHVRHALALDELRWPFKPRVYIAPTEPLGEGRSFRQVWFRGAHADVGGGYRADGLSNVALQWMAHEALDQGLLLDRAALDRHRGNPLGTLHSEVMSWPFWGLVGVFRREFDFDRIPVHASVLERAQALGPERVPLPPGVRVEPAHPRESRVAPGQPAPPPRQRLPGWVVPAWGLGVAGLCGLVWRAAADRGTALALDLQLGLSRAPWWNLGQALRGWSREGGAEVVALMRWDQWVLVPTYTALVMLGVLLALQVPAPRYPAPRTGRWLALAAVALPLADTLENLLTVQALATAQAAVRPAGWLPDALVDGAVSLLVTLASGVKLAALGVLLGLAARGLLRLLTR
jgi:hypothetical protein